MLKTFIGGVHPKGQKESTENKAIQQARLPSRAVIPMIQHTGAPCEPLVKIGDMVKKGQLIGKSDKFISSPVHASISGVVKEVKEAPHPTVGKAVSVVIESDGKDEQDESVKKRENAAGLPKEQIVEIVREAGIVGLGGAAFPTHVKLKPPKKIDTVILNGAECEPYLTCDDRMMIERPGDVTKGLLLIMKALEVNKAIIAIESNKPKAIKSINEELRNSGTRADFLNKEITLKALPAKYPQGSEKQLIEAVLKRRVPPKGLPLDVGCVVHNTGTAIAISEAVYDGKPLIERVVTITGDCIKEPLNLNVRIGTTAGELLEECGGAVRGISKVVAGGPIMGIAQCTMEVPVIKGTSGVLFLSSAAACIFDEMPCIKCARCVDACPMNLLPLMYAKFVKKEKWGELDDCNIEDCIECGACSYVCPGRIPLVHYIKTGKKGTFLWHGI